jgi:hypothetical protein
VTNSLTGEKVLTDSPAVAALAYPGMLFFFYESSHIFRSTDHASIRAVALVGAVLSLSLAYGVSLLGFSAAYVLGARSNQSRHTERARLLAHLVVASPPLFTAIGVLCFLLHAPNADYIAWLVIWIPLVIFAVVNGRYTANVNTNDAWAATYRRQEAGKPPVVSVIERFPGPKRKIDLDAEWRLI